MAKRKEHWTKRTGRNIAWGLLFALGSTLFIGLVDYSLESVRSFRRWYNYEITPKRELVSRTRAYLLKILDGIQCDFPDQIRKSWNWFEINDAPEVLVEGSYEHGITPMWQLAMISQETGGCFDPKVISRRNADGSRDLGLSQQNSYYVQGRCRSVYGSRCSHSAILTAAVSVRLMQVRLNVCSGYHSDPYGCNNVLQYRESISQLRELREG